MIGLLRRGFEEEVTTSGVLAALEQHSPKTSGEETEQLASSLASFLRGVPDALACALAMSDDRRSGRSIAFATGTILHYVFDETDLLPETSYGPLGMLDDAYLVHDFVVKLSQAYPFADGSSAGYSAPDPRAFEQVASLLPDGVAHSLARTSDSTIQVAQALFPPALADSTVDAPLTLEIRVEEALAVARER